MKHWLDRHFIGYDNCKKLDGKCILYNNYSVIQHDNYCMHTMKYLGQLFVILHEMKKAAISNWMWKDFKKVLSTN